MFVFSAGTFLDELSSYAPEVFAAAARTYERAEKGDLLRPRPEDMCAIPRITIDLP
jgi:mannose-1-phosphate guanylyltransferase